MSHAIPAALLVGGSSKRMGRDKLLLRLGGMALYERVLQQLYPYCSPLLMVGRRLPIHIDKKAIFLPDTIQNWGPLSGITAALHFTKTVLQKEWVFIAAGDLGFVNAEIVFHLLQFTNRTPYSIVMPMVGTFPQPLFALYRSELAEKAYSLLSHGERKVLALAERCNVRYVPLSELGFSFETPNSDIYLSDIDTPEDYKKALRFLGGHV